MRSISKMLSTRLPSTQTDMRSQYTSIPFFELLAEAEIRSWGYLRGWCGGGGGGGVGRWGGGVRCFLRMWVGCCGGYFFVTGRGRLPVRESLEGICHVCFF